MLQTAGVATRKQLNDSGDEASADRRLLRLRSYQAVLSKSNTRSQYQFRLLSDQLFFIKIFMKQINNLNHSNQLKIKTQNQSIRKVYKNLKFKIQNFKNYNFSNQVIKQSIKMKFDKIKDEQEGQSFQKLNRADKQQQLDSSSVQSRVNQGILKKAKQRQKVFTHNQLIKDPLFRSLFKIQQRTGNWIYSCFRCLNSQSSYVTLLQQQQRKYTASLSQGILSVISLSQEQNAKLKIKYQDQKLLSLHAYSQILTQCIHLSSNFLSLSYSRIHIVDRSTGSYLKASNQDENYIYSKEEITYMNTEKKYESCANNSLLPFATNCCDFRQLGDSRGIWNQKFFINLHSQQILNPNTIILFQILDFNHQALVYKDTDIYDKDNYYRVAWGFLRPVGIGKTHFGKTKIQLFRYKFNNKTNQPVLNNPFVPSVYYDFIWNNHQKYQGFLTVHLIAIDKPKYHFVDDDQYPKNIFEEEKKDKKYVERFISADDRKQQNQQNQIKQQLLKFYRNRNHCEIPKQMIYKLQSGKLGCYRVKFVGNYLFAACSDKHTTNVKVFNLQNGQKVMSLKGHRQIIHGLTTNSNPADGKEKYLITSGSDHFVRIWKIPQNYGQYIDQDQSEQYLVGECMHTAAVYSSAAILINLKDVMYTITCCYDGYVRLWQTFLAGQRMSRSSKIVKQIFINNSQRLSDKVYPTCSAISPSNQIYIGDSLGNISIFNFQNSNIIFQNIVTSPQLSRDAILSIQIVQRHLFVQSSDNMIRRFQLSGNKLHQDKKYAGGQFQNLLLNAKISPDFKYLLSPSQSGKPVMWDVFTGTKIDIDYLNLNIKGALTCCDWHPKYNLIVVSGFVKQCPIFVFGNVLSESQMKIVMTV